MFRSHPASASSKSDSYLSLDDVRFFLCRWVGVTCQVTKENQKGQVLSNCANTAVSSWAYSVLRATLSLSACCQSTLHFQRIVSYFYTPRFLSCLTSKCVLLLHSSLSLVSPLGVRYCYTPRFLSCLTSKCVLLLHSSLSLLSHL